MTSVRVRALNKRMERIKTVQGSKIEIKDYKLYRGLRIFHLESLTCQLNLAVTNNVPYITIISLVYVIWVLNELALNLFNGKNWTASQGVCGFLLLKET